jgi:ParB family chromosome partitioning protein
MLVNIDDIKVKKRVRKDLGDIDSLKESLKIYGLMNPITLNSKYQLIAGERRLQAAKELGWTHINANIIENINSVQALEMELEENNQRKEFTDEELMEGYTRLKHLQHPNIFRKIWNLLVRFFTWIVESIKKLFSKK